MWVSELWIYWETRGSLRDNLALERRAVAPAHCNVMHSMKFTPYKEVLGICFGSLEATIIEIHGKPERDGENRLGSNELIFPDKIFRLRPSDGGLH